MVKEYCMNKKNYFKKSVFCYFNILFFCLILLLAISMSGYSAPILIFPLEKSGMAADEINFLWNSANQNTQFLLEISKDTEFNPLVYRKETYLLDDNIKDNIVVFSAGRYFWRVGEKNNGNIEYSNISFFEIAEKKNEPVIIEKEIEKLVYIDPVVIEKEIEKIVYVKNDIDTETQKKLVKSEELNHKLKIELEDKTNVIAALNKRYNELLNIQQKNEDYKTKNDELEKQIQQLKLDVSKITRDYNNFIAASTNKDKELILLKEENKKYANKIDELEKQYSFSNLKYGELLSESDKYRTIINNLRETIKALRSQLSEMQFEKINKSVKSSDFYRALKDIDKIKNIDTDNDELYYNSAVIYYKLKDYNKALDEINKALSINPENSENQKLKTLIQKK